MSFRNLLRETLLSLTAHKTRSLLTTLGIIIGIAAVIIMVALGNGTKASIENSLQSIGSNLIMISPGQNSSVVPGAAKSVTAQTLTIEDAEAIEREVPGVKSLAPQMQAAFEVVADSENVNVPVTGTTVSYPAIRSIELAYGNWFSEGDQDAGARAAVLGATTSDKLFGTGSNPVGQQVRVNGVPFEVVGVTEAKGGSGADEVVYVTLNAMRQHLAGGRSLAMISIEAADQDSVEAVTAGAHDVLLREHDIVDPEDADFTVTSMKDLSSTMDSISSMLTALLGSIAGISLVVGGIGIMNMMLTSVTERTREIGLRKALGAKPADISAQFLFESVALTFVGGVVGLLLGVMVCALITASGVLQAVISAGSVGLAIGVSTLIGIVFGYYPARNAARLDPIEALRYQ